MTDSGFLNDLIGLEVRIICRHSMACGESPMLLLREISPLGIVGESQTRMHFFPWTEVVEITDCPDIGFSHEIALAAFADSET